MLRDLLASASSYAAQAVARGPQTAAPPSFDGHGWLVVLNLSWMTVTALTAAMVVFKLLGGLWRGWRDPAGEAKLGRPHGPLVRLLRIIMLIAFSGMMVRTGVEALTLWGWDASDPVTTGRYLLIKRLLDPFGAGAYWLSICLYIMTEDALLGSLTREPFPKRLVARLPKLRRPLKLAALTLVAAILVVSLR